MARTLGREVISTRQCKIAELARREPKLTLTTLAHHISEQIIIQQGLPRAEWDALLEWMVEEHAMEPLHGLDRDRILSYLETHYGQHVD